MLHVTNKYSVVSRYLNLSLVVTSLFTIIQLQETIDIAINLIYNHFNFSFLLHDGLILLLIKNFIIKLME